MTDVAPLDEARLLAECRREEAVPFSGWDFAYLNHRWREEPPTWSYEELARSLLGKSRAALDLGTGGGERLAALAEAFPPRVAATEGHPPNLALARQALTPHGVEVFATGASTALPFPDASFDLVLDRHTAFDAAEVARVLTTGGVFLTQQVDGHSLSDLMAFFGVQPQFPEITLEPLREQLVRAGFMVELALNYRGHSVFDDVGAIVYYLKAVPWTVPGFSVERHRDALLALEARRAAGQRLAFDFGRFVIQARRPVP